MGLFSLFVFRFDIKREKAERKRKEREVGEKAERRGGRGEKEQEASVY